MFANVLKDSAASSKAWESRKRNSKAMADANFKDLQALSGVKGKGRKTTDEHAKEDFKKLKQQVRENNKAQEEHNAGHSDTKQLKAAGKDIFTKDSGFEHSWENDATAFMNKDSLAASVAQAKKNGYKVEQSKNLFHEELPGIPQTTKFRKGGVTVVAEANRNPADDFVSFDVRLEKPIKKEDLTAAEVPKKEDKPKKWGYGKGKKPMEHTQKSAFQEALLA